MHHDANTTKYTDMTSETSGIVLTRQVAHALMCRPVTISRRILTGKGIFRYVVYPFKREPGHEANSCAACCRVDATVGQFDTFGNFITMSSLLQSTLHFVWPRFNSSWILSHTGWIFHRKCDHLYSYGSMAKAFNRLKQE